MGIPSKARDVLIAEVRESFGRVAYSHKVQEKEADRQKALDDRVRLAQLLLSSFTTAGVLVIVVKDAWWLDLITGLLAFTTSALIAYTKNFRAGEVAKEHQAAAQRMWLIRERYLSLISDLEAESGSLESARERRDALQTELSNVYEQAPRTSASAYLAAQQALQVNDELTFTDAEIDKFLPALLRKAGNPAPTTADGQDSTGEGT